MNLSEHQIAVTGADGFIGSHLVEELVRRGCRVRALVQYNSFNSWGWLDRSSPEILSRLEVVAVDVRDPNGTHHALAGCTVVFHLAALIAIPYSYEAPHAYVETNVGGTLNVLQAARASRVAKVVHTSTSEVYGTAQRVPISEDHPIRAQSPYAATKIAADQLAVSFHHSFDLPVTILRPFNTYGPRQSARAVIPSIVTQLASGGPLRIGALTPTRDFSFVDDTVSAFIAVAESDRTTGEIINAGSNFEISIDETARLIAKVMQTELVILEDESRLRPAKSEVERLWADTSKLRELTNWRPRFAGLDGLKRGIERTVEWFTRPENLALYKTSTYNT